MQNHSETSPLQCYPEEIQRKHLSQYNRKSCDIAFSIILVLKILVFVLFFGSFLSDKLNEINLTIQKNKPAQENH